MEHEGDLGKQEEKRNSSVFFRAFTVLLPFEERLPHCGPDTTPLHMTSCPEEEIARDSIQGPGDLSTSRPNSPKEISFHALRSVRKVRSSSRLSKLFLKDRDRS